MCPEATIGPAVELDKYWTDEDVFKSLVLLKSGCSLPQNVLPDVDPYQCMPSNLPEDMWYFCSGTKKDAEGGFWMSSGEACEIYTTSAIIGLRKTLQFYEGRAPHGQKTNWMMQEYTTEEYGSKLMQDPRALCRVFLAEDKRSSEQHSESELLEKNMDGGTGPSAMAKKFPDSTPAVADRSLDQPSAMANRFPDPSIENSRDIDCILTGDYLELDDLGVSVSGSSSFADSSCMTLMSEEFFDPDDLMRVLGDDPEDQEIQDSSVKLNLSAPTKSNEVVMNPHTSGFLENGKECKASTGETSKTDETPQNKAGDHKTENSNTSSTSSDEKKDRGGRTTKKRKVMKYLCFLMF